MGRHKKRGRSWPKDKAGDARFNALIQRIREEEEAKIVIPPMTRSAEEITAEIRARGQREDA